MAQSILLLALGLFIRYHIARRRFNRRSIAGVQLYGSYFIAFITRMLETLSNWLGAWLMTYAVLHYLMSR